MTFVESGEELLKVDTLDRVRTSRARREAILDEFERTGGSGVQFAALLGIKYPTFASWIQSRRRQQAAAGDTKAAAAAGGPVWLEAVVGKASASSSPAKCAGSAHLSVPGLQVHLPGGAQVEMIQLGQAPLLAALLRELEAGNRPC